jgi:hyperosmotically inducible periplasmic protein
MNRMMSTFLVGRRRRCRRIHFDRKNPRNEHARDRVPQRTRACALRWVFSSSNVHAACVLLHKGNIMNKHSRKLLGATVIGAAVLFTTACAPTQTSRGTGEVVDDASITTRVKAALINDPDVKARQIEVETYRGIVQLSGFVESAQVATRATGIASKVSGVRSVKNSMQVRAGT